MGFGKMVVRLVEQNPQLFKRVVTSTPTPVDVSAEEKLANIINSSWKYSWY